MKLLKDKRFYRFLIPSLIGLFLFVIPVPNPLPGETGVSIPIGIAAKFLEKLVTDYFGAISWALISLSAIISILHKIFQFSFLKRYPKIDAVFSLGGFWFGVRMIGFVLINMIYFEIGPDFLIGPETGAKVVVELLPALATIFLLGGIFLSFLIDYGLLDFLGTFLIKIMRPIFRLPGRSALNCITSWLGDGSLGVLLSCRQYEDGYYSKREATVVATTFSAVSITFCLLISDEVGLSGMFLPFYLVVTLAGILAAMVVVRIPPLSKIPDTYCKEVDISEEIPKGMSVSQFGMKRCLEKAENSPGVKGFCKAGIDNVVEMVFGTLPAVLAVATFALILHTETPIFEWLGYPFLPLYQLLQIPEAEMASQTVIVGFADMFIPSVIASESIASEMTRFVVAATSVTQLIYMSEIGGIIMTSKISVPFWKLFVIFLERTLVTLPVIALIAHLLF